MASNRDHLFPSTSIGRTHGARISRNPSHDSLAAHPLLSPTSPTPPAPELQHSSPSGSPSGPTMSSNLGPRYVPYTPRQRVAATVPTTGTSGTTVHPPSFQPHQGDATSKLQIMNLKAAAQNVGLDTGTLGWSILEKIVLENDGSEWAEIMSALTSGKATLLLPLEQASSSDKLTADFVKDHVVFCDGPLRKNAPIVTLSGLRGVLDNLTLIIRSSIHPTSKLFLDLLTSPSRSSALGSLPPLPQISSSLITAYPTFSLPSHTSSLPLPPRASGVLKPPLPPRPSLRPNLIPASSNSSSTSRLSNPFASLFGNKPSSSPMPAPTVSPPASIHNFDPPVDPSLVVEISAFTIDRRLVRKDVGKQMNKALKAEVKESLSSTDSGLSVPSWVVDRVNEFTQEWYPVVKAPSSARKSLGRGGEKSSAGYVVNAIEEPPEECSERLQDFYHWLEDDYLRLGGASLAKKREGKEEVLEDEKDSILEKKTPETDSEAKMRDVLELVERTICSSFYDRLFMQSTSDDANHDEALSSRVAALNMLDLGLEHLDIHVGMAGADLDLVVKACGDMLTQLEACQSPADKAAVLVAAHKIVVDGLARLPPIRLKSEDESEAQTILAVSSKSPKPATIPLGGELKPLVPRTVNQTREDQSATEKSLTSPTIIEPTSTSESSPESVTSPSAPSPQPSSPQLMLSPPAQATPVSGDVLLPMIIFSVVKANPPHLVSNLLYTQRYRNQSVGGEEGYCLINLMAVAEFLENVDLAALGLGDSDKVLSTADLTPIPINRSTLKSDTPLAATDGIHGSLRGRVEQQVDAIAGSANKVITGVVDSSFGILRSFLPAPDLSTPGLDGTQSAAPWNSVRPGFGLLRRESGFSIASMAASIPIPGVRSSSRATNHEESGQQLVTVSRPGSVKSRASSKVKVGDSDEEGSGSEESSSDGEGDEEEGEDQDEASARVSDGKSIRSFESMMSGQKRNRNGKGGRISLSDRLAHVSGLAALKGSPPTSRRSSLLPHAPTQGLEPTASSRPGSPMALRLAPPNQRFMECTPDDLKLSEIGELLREYRRLVNDVRSVGGFDE